MGVEAMHETIDLVNAGKAPRIKQDDSKAPYEGRRGPDNAKIDWSKPWEQINRVIRGCNPAPGVWATLDCKQLKVFDGTLLPAKDSKGANGRSKIIRVQSADSKKIDIGEFAAISELATEMRFT